MKRLLFFATVLLLTMPLQAQQQVDIRAPRPKVGVVLGGGGGQPTLCVAGGRNADGLPKAMELLKEKI